MLPMIAICFFFPVPHSAFISNSAKTSHRTLLVSTFPQDLRTRSLRGEYCYVLQHSCDLADKLPASSRSRCHYHSHSEIPGTYVSRSNLDALPVMLFHPHVTLLPDLLDHGRYPVPTLSLVIV